MCIRDSYDTPDGTGVRDYIHVVDLAVGHVKAIKYIFSNPGLDIINLGTGVGYSVLDMVKAFSKACGKEIPYEIKPRREGDIAMLSLIHILHPGDIFGLVPGMLFLFRHQ